MGLSTTFDVSRVTNLENRLTADEAAMITNNNTGQQSINTLKITGMTNAFVMDGAPANNGQWLGIMNGDGTYSIGLGRYATGSKAVEMRAYYDNLTFRTGRSGTATSAEMNFITNDQDVAGILQNINLMPRGNVNICPANGGTNTNGVAATLNAAGQPCFKAINSSISNASLKWGSTGLYVRDQNDANYQPIFSSAFNVASDMSFKTDVQDYSESALDHIKNTKVRKYKLKNDNPQTPDRIGLIRDEAPQQLQTEDSTLDLYQMCSMLWKSVQELSAELDSLKGAAAK